MVYWRTQVVECVVKDFYLERFGVVLKVRYERHETLPPWIESIHIVVNGHPVGPDLLPLLHGTLVMVGPGAAEPFVSTILTEMENSYAS